MNVLLKISVLGDVGLPFLGIRIWALLLVYQYQNPTEYIQLDLKKVGSWYLNVHLFILEIVIPRATKNKENLQIYYKSHYFFFCAEPQTKISRHHKT